MGAPYSFTFQRTEVKYRIPADRYEEFRKEMDPYIGLDSYGLSTICNIYYDTADRKLITRSLAKPAYKEKLRLRSYGIPKADSTVFPELKKKVEGVVYKRRCAMTLQEAEAFLNRREMPSENGQVQKELAYARDFYGLRPALFLAYDREAFVGRQDPEMRMTIDRRIRFREDHLSLSEGDGGEELDLNGDYLLEVKVNGALPLPIVRIFNRLGIYPASFSKYGAVYTELMGRNRRRETARQRQSAKAPVLRPAYGRYALQA